MRGGVGFRPRTTRFLRLRAAALRSGPTASPPFILSVAKRSRRTLRQSSPPNRIRDRGAAAPAGALDMARWDRAATTLRRSLLMQRFLVPVQIEYALQEGAASAGPSRRALARQSHIGSCFCYLMFVK